MARDGRSKNEEAALDVLWRGFHSPDGSIAHCPDCRESRRFHRVTGRRAYVCDRCGTHVYPAADTPFAGSHLPLADWLTATAVFFESGGLTTPTQLSHALGVGYRTSWHMLRRLKHRNGATDNDQARLRECARLWMELAGVESLESAELTRGQVDRIRQAACRVLTQRGLSATRVSDIASEAGIPGDTIHYYFRNKDEVLLAALRWKGEQLHARLRQCRETSMDPLSQLRGLLDVSLPMEQPIHDEYVLWLEVWARVRIRPGLLEECVRMSNQWFQAVRAVMAHGVQEGVFSPVAPLDEVCARYVTMADCLACRAALGYEGFTADRARLQLVRFAAEQLCVDPSELDERASPSPHSEAAEHFPVHSERPCTGSPPVGLPATPPILG